MTKTKRQLLLVEDDRLLCAAVRDRLSSEALEVRVAHTAAEARAAYSAGAVDVVILDEHLPDGSGHGLCAPILEAHPSAKLVVVTAYPSFEHAVGALKAGAYDYLCKPFELEALELAVRRCLETIELERVGRLAAWRRAKDQEEVVLVGGAGMAQVRELVRLAADSDAPVLVTGETGTGKNLVAKAIHFSGPRRGGPFVGLNCAALPESLIEAELFGWERGSFTGALATREGLVELAHEGTLFLDEIGEMPLHLQTKLLAVLEDRQVKRLGGRTTRTVDARIIAATNADLEARVADGQFRADLYYRLDVVRAHLPPLRDHPSDISPLCRHLACRLVGRDRPPAFAAGEMERLEAYPWPGNVRELRNVLERSLVLHREPLRPSELLRPVVSAGGPGAAAATGGAPAAEVTLEVMERGHIERAVSRCDGNLAQAAAALGISLSTLKRRVRQFGAGRANLTPSDPI